MNTLGLKKFLVFHLNTAKLDLYLKKYNSVYLTKESKKAKRIKLARWLKQQRDINNPEKSNNSHHCICTEGNGEGFMLQCDACKVWYHPECINMKNTDIILYSIPNVKYACPFCEKVSE
jgi:hypothetical protein